MDSVPYVTGWPSSDSRIVRAAIYVPSLRTVYTGWRHDAIMRELRERQITMRAGGHPDDQGFTDQYGMFLSRDDAKRVAKKSGQIKQPIIGSVLTSEDLWDKDGNAPRN